MGNLLLWSRRDAACPGWTKNGHCACVATGIICTPKFTYYAQSGLVVIGTLLFGGAYRGDRIGRHRLVGVTRVRVVKWNSVPSALELLIYTRSGPSIHVIRILAIQHVRTIQRWWRRARVALAVCMSQHARLGQNAGLAALGPDLLRLCL